MLDKENLTVLTDAISKIMNKESVTEEIEIELDEATEITEKLKAAKGKSVLDIDFAGDESEMDGMSSKYKIKMKKGKIKGTALVAGENKNILAYLQSDDYDMDDENIMDIYPEVVAEAYDRISTEAVIGPFSFSKNSSDDELLNMYHAAVDAYSSGYRLMHPKSDYKKAITQIKNILKKRGVDTDNRPIGKDDPAMLAYRAAREGYDRDKLVNKIVKPIKDKEKMFPKSKKEASGDKEEYQKFFNAAMKKFGVKSPAELKGDKEKEFYNYIDKNWKGDHEESVEEARKEPFTPFAKSDAFITKDRDPETGRGEFYNVRSGEGFKIIKTFKTMKDAEKFLDKINKMDESINEHVGANGHAGPVQDINQGLSPKAKLVKAFQEPETPDYADANKTALSTFANIMNSVNVAMDYRASDNKVQDVAPENTIQKLANSTK